MARRKLLTIILLLSSLSVSARVLPNGFFFDRFRMGVEWGYSQCFLLVHSYNYISEEGSRFYDETRDFHLQPNGLILGYIGMDLGERFNLSLYGGYLGVGRDNRLFPVLLRGSWFPRGTRDDGGLFFLQAGPALHGFPEGRKVAWLGSLGGGYRIRLSDDCFLDLLGGLKLLYDHPLIPNPEGPGHVPARNIRKNNAGYCALDLTISVSF